MAWSVSTVLGLVASTAQTSVDCHWQVLEFTRYCRQTFSCKHRVDASINQTLPERIREWNLTSCKSAEANQKELVKIRNELGTAREKLEEVDRLVDYSKELKCNGVHMQGG